MSKWISNKQYEIVQGIVFVLATIGIIALICALYELKEIRKDIKEYKIQRIK